MQKQPPEEGRKQKQKIGKGRPPGAQRAQKTVHRAQCCAGQTGPKEPLRRKLRRGHRSSLPSQLPLGRGSS